MPNCVKCHQPQTAAPVICPECYRALTERTVSMETDKLIEALRCCGIRVGDKNCGECPVCATEEIKCPELMALAADKLEELNDFSQSQTAKLLGHIAKKDIEINRLSQLAMMREGEIGDRDREIAEKDKRLTNARNELCQRCGKYRMAHKGACDGCRWRGPQEAGKEAQTRTAPAWAEQFERRFLGGEE